MRPTRLFGFRWTPADTKSARAAEALTERLMSQGGWRLAIKNRRGVLLLVKDCGRGDHLVLPDEMGVVLGPIFSRSTERAVKSEEADRSLADAWVGSAGRILIEDYWGSYLAVLHDRAKDALHIVRDPMGAGACFTARTPWRHVFFTHAADYVWLFPDCAFDRDYLAAFLVSPRLVSEQTAIAGVEEVPAGARLTLGRTGATSELLWRPAPKRTQAKAIEFGKAARELKERILLCARAWAEASPRILHRLSGGLDSSTALAALSQARARGDIVCINEYPKGVPEGDEREMARRVAKTFRAPIVELAIGPEDVAYERVLDVEISAKPSLSELSFAGRVFADFLAGENFGLLTSGQGGDQVLHRSRTAEIAADAVRDGLGPSELVGIACATARLGRRPVWDVFAAQLKYGLLRRPYDPAAGLVSASALASAEAPALAAALWRKHVFSEEARKATPARAKRMLRIADLQFYHNPSVLTDRIANALVLTAQPVVEFCLSVAPYVMTQGGRDRALERAAFADALPPEVASRSLKGDTTRHFTAVLERNLDFLRSVLIGGRLAAEKLVSTGALEQALGFPRIANGKIASGLMQCLTAELWLRRFEAARRASSASTDEREQEEEKY